MKRSEPPVVGQDYWTPIFSSVSTASSFIDIRVVHVRLLCTEEAKRWMTPDGEQELPGINPQCVCVGLYKDGKTTCNSYTVPAASLFDTPEEAWDNVHARFEKAFKHLEEYKEKHKDDLHTNPYTGIIV